MKSELKTVSVILPDKSMVEGTFELWEEAPDNPDLLKITLRFMNREIASQDARYGYCLEAIREKLEPEGILLKCYGSSRNVHASSCSGDMGGGGMAYKLFLGKPGERKDVVSIFNSGVDVDPCTMREQKEFFRRYLLSLGIVPGKAVYPWKQLFRQEPLRTAIYFAKVQCQKLGRLREWRRRK